MRLEKYECLASMRSRIMHFLELYKFYDSEVRLSDIQRQELDTRFDFFQTEMLGGCFLVQFIREMHENILLAQDSERVIGFYRKGVRALLIPDKDIPDVDPIYSDALAIWNDADQYNAYLEKWVIPQLEKELAIYDNQSDMPSLQATESDKEDDNIKTKCPKHLADIFDKMVACDLMAKRGEQWEWLGKKGLYGYFIDTLCDSFNLKDDRDSIPWKMFEPYIINASLIKATARQTVNGYKNKYLPPPQGDNIIKSLLASN